MCLHQRRIGVSAAFFVELEFQKTGYVVYRMYRAAYGTLTNAPSRANLLYAQFMPDRAGLVGGPQLEQSTVDFANRFVQRSEFKTAYPDTLTPADLVNKLFDTATLTPFASERLQEISALQGGTKTRAQVLLDVTDIQAFKDREYNPAFVLMQYYGYLRRDPDQAGYDFWLNVLNNREPNNFRGMVCSFITSTEYQERFSPVSNRSNLDCQVDAPSGNLPPVVYAGAPQTIALPLNTATLSGLVTDDGQPAGGAISVLWTKMSGPAGVTFANPTLTTTMATFGAEGNYVLRLSANDSQLTNAADVVIKVLPANLPADPANVAPLLDNTVATTIGTATTFLYSGANPIQTGVAPGTIDPTRAAVLRGRVVTRDESAVPGVKITVLNHAEFGQTRTRADGRFDMAVNGGGLLTVVYEKPGLLTLQRQENVPRQDYVTLPDVVMIAYDSRVTTIDLSGSTSMQVAQANPVMDGDGRRQATLLFPPGTSATIIKPDGSTSTVATMHVRATEYTVGASGPKAMPAVLPPSSGYTYAAELSVDEAVAAGATEVRFNQALPVYVENFLGFPVGTAVPAGYYDRQKGQWIASANGRVIKVLSLTGGLADLDTDGDAAADNATKLAALGVTADERARLAQLYTPGQTLWRVPITHFSAVGFQLALRPAARCGVRRRRPDQNNPALDDPYKECGSVIGCENQSLGESLPVTGTPLAAALPERTHAGPQGSVHPQYPPERPRPCPTRLKRMRVEVIIGGRRFAAEFSPAANPAYTFTWDGKDAYGRTLQGEQPVIVNIGYVYSGVVFTAIAMPYSYDALFGHCSDCGTPVLRIGRLEVTLSRTVDRQAGRMGCPCARAGRLEPQHSARLRSGVPHAAAGRWPAAPRRGACASDHHHRGGQRRVGFSGDGGPATAAQLNGSLMALPWDRTAACSSRIRATTASAESDPMASSPPSRAMVCGASAATAGRRPWRRNWIPQGRCRGTGRQPVHCRPATPHPPRGTQWHHHHRGGHVSGLDGFSGDGGPATAAQV